MISSTANQVTTRRALAAVLVLAIVAGAWAFANRSQASAADGSPPPRLLTFNGTGSAQVAPDTATLNVGVQTTGASADAALDAASSRMERVIGRLRREGLSAKDLQTSDVSTYQDYEDDKRWRASQSLTVTLDEPDRAGKLLGIATEAGADTVNGPSFSLDDQRSGYDEALRHAVADARAKADAAAALMDRRVNEVVSVREGQAQGQVYDMAAPMAQMADADSAKTAPVEQGTLAVSMTVEVAFSYRDA